jgi:hypothetical protein
MIQMKRDNSWKEYYAVLTHGFIVLYKEGLSKTKVKKKKKKKKKKEGKKRKKKD